MMYARAFQMVDFDRNLKRLEQINPEIHSYLFGVSYNKWARCFSHRSHYELMTTNISECLNAIFSNAREYPIVSLAQFYCDKLQKGFSERHMGAASTLTKLPGWAEARLKEQCNLAGSMEVSF